jgi:hypothetical protein
MLPKDPVLLVSVLNTKLRDYYGSLDELCEDLDESKEDILNCIETQGYFYDEISHQFKKRK